MSPVIDNVLSDDVIDNDVIDNDVIDDDDVDIDYKLVEQMKEQSKAILPEIEEALTEYFGRD